VKNEDLIACATHHMVQSALASAAEALPPPAVRVPRGIKQTQQRGSGRLQFGHAIGRADDVDADEDAAAELSQMPVQ
jgi:hypothetical protein